MTTHNHNDGKENNENNINLPQKNVKKDPAGTDPNRYQYFADGPNEDKDSDTDADYAKEPKNHTTTDERLLNPDRGEQ